MKISAEMLRKYERTIAATLAPPSVVGGLALATHLQFGTSAVVVEFVVAVGSGALSLTAFSNGWSSEFAWATAFVTLAAAQAAITTYSGFGALSFYAWAVNAMVSLAAWSVLRHKVRHDHHTYRMDELKLQLAETRLYAAQKRLAPPYEPNLTGSTPQEASLRRAFYDLYKVELSAVVVSTGDDDSWDALVDLPPQLHRDKAAKEVARVAGAMALPGRLEAHRGPLSSQLALRYLEGDLLSRTIPYEPSGAHSFLDPVLLGLDLYGREVLVELVYNHVLIAGSSKFGKSNVVKLIALRLAALMDTVLYGVDMKPGAPEFSLLRPIFHDLATNVEQARAMFGWLVQEMHERGAILADAGDTEWNPAKHGRPFIVVLVDEVGELVRQGDVVEKGQKPMSSILESILALARAYGITLVLATQQPSNRIFGGSTDARGNLAVRMSMRMNDTRHGQFVFPNSTWKPNALDAPGKFLILSPEHGSPVESRAQYVADGVGGAEVARLSIEKVPAPIGHRVILPAPTGLNNQQRIMDRLAQYREMSRKELEAGCGLNKDQVLRALRELGPEVVQDRVTYYWSLRPDEGLFAGQKG